MFQNRRHNFRNVFLVSGNALFASYGPRNSGIHRNVFLLAVFTEDVQNVHLLLEYRLHAINGLLSVGYVGLLRGMTS